VKDLSDLSEQNDLIAGRGALSRRKLLFGAGAASLGICLSPLEMFKLAAGAVNLTRPAKIARSIVVIQLSGGNDGLNMVVPYGTGKYYDLRPTIAIKPGEAINLNGKIGLNPQMSALGSLYEKGHVAIVQACGYPNPNRSHFRSIEIWQTAQPDIIGSTGWLGRLLDLSSQRKDNSDLHSVLPAVNIDSVLPMTLVSHKFAVPSVSNVADFQFRTDPQYAGDRNAQLKAFSDIYADFGLKRPHVELLTEAGMEASKASDHLLSVISGYKQGANYPPGKLGNGLKFIAQMITGSVNAKVYTVSLDGFDTHTKQLQGQGAQLRQLSDSIAAFYADLSAHRCENEVLTFVFSEFGRRAGENGSNGTDHGTAEPCMVIGGAVRGGIYGEPASLTDLDNGDLKYQMDFRKIYASILDKWFNVDHAEVLGKKFETIPFLKDLKRTT
jgi:uncharacterized protein (DUF1501 family)